MLKQYSNYQIVSFGKLTYAENLANLNNLENSPNYSFAQGDICNLGIVNEIMEKVDQIVHFAAESHVDHSIEDGAIFVRTRA